MIQRDAGRALVTERSDSLQQALDIYQTDLEEILQNSDKKNSAKPVFISDIPKVAAGRKCRQK